MKFLCWLRIHWYPRQWRESENCAPAGRFFHRVCRVCGKTQYGERKAGGDRAG